MYVRLHVQGRSRGGVGGKWFGRPSAAENQGQQSEYFELKMWFSALKKF
jgi:hypothetical protein